MALRAPLALVDFSCSIRCSWVFGGVLNLIAVPFILDGDSCHEQNLCRVWVRKLDTDFRDLIGVQKKTIQSIVRERRQFIRTVFLTVR